MPQDSAKLQRTHLTASWDRLAALAARPAARDIRALFASDPNRAGRFSASLDDLTIDFSKTSIDAEALAALLGLARVATLNLFRDRLFEG